MQTNSLQWNINNGSGTLSLTTVSIPGDIILGGLTGQDGKEMRGYLDDISIYHQTITAANLKTIQGS